MFCNDVVKIKFVKEGYLPNWPYHLISDEEMCDAFMTYPWYDYRTSDEKSEGVELSSDEIWKRFLDGSEPCYFRDKYPMFKKSTCAVREPLIDEQSYRTLVEFIVSKINSYKKNGVALPDWVYSYMLGEVIGPDTAQLDMHYTLVMLDTDNDFDEFTPEAAKACYDISKRWLTRYIDVDKRPPTMFGEPHVLKYLRLRAADMS